MPTADIYVQVPGGADASKDGAWDLALDQWSPDWYGNNAVNYFYPNFDSASDVPAGANSGLYDNSSVNSLISAGEDATSASAAARDWTKADQAIMQQAVIFPIDTVKLRGLPFQRGS